MTADRVTVIGMRMPGKAPASVHMTVALADPDREGGQQRQLADVRPDSGPELITVARKDVLEIGLEPTRQSGASVEPVADGSMEPVPAARPGTAEMLVMRLAGFEPAALRSGGARSIP